MEIEALITNLQFTLYDDLFEPFTKVELQDADARVLMGTNKKVNFSFSSLHIQNKNRYFQELYLDTFLFIGATKEPTREVDAAPIVLGSDPSKSFIANTLPGGFLNESNFSGIQKDPSLILGGRSEDGIYLEHMSMGGNSQYLGKIVRNTKNKLKTNSYGKEKGGLIYFDQKDNKMEIYAKLVNLVVFFDAEYIQKIQALVGRFTKPETDEEAKIRIDKMFVKPEDKQPPPNPEIVQKIKAEIDRLCLVCRSKSRALQDIVMRNVKVNIHQYISKMLLNLYVKKMGIRDLTEYPFTKPITNMQDYRTAKKRTIIKFSDDPSVKSGNDIDNNGVIVLTEVAKPEYKGSYGQKIGVKAQVYLNNGVMHYFGQPIFRLMDFIFMSLMPVAAPDNTPLAPTGFLIDMINDPSRVLHNVFIKNLQMHMRPNFEMEEYPVLLADEVIVFNRLNPHDPSRLNPGKRAPQGIKIPTEDMNIKIVNPRIVSYDRKVNFMTFGTLEVMMNKFMFGGQWERIFDSKKQSKLSF